jgi:hypothetical protein
MNSHEEKRILRYRFRDFRIIACLTDQAAQIMIGEPY